jgi:hypothetical protein
MPKIQGLQENEERECKDLQNSPLHTFFDKNAEVGVSTMLETLTPTVGKFRRLIASRL